MNLKLIEILVVNNKSDSEKFNEQSKEFEITKFFTFKMQISRPTNDENMQIMTIFLVIQRLIYLRVLDFLFQFQSQKSVSDPQ